MKFSRAGIKQITDSASVGKNTWEYHSGILCTEKTFFCRSG